MTGPAADRPDGDAGPEGYEGPATVWAGSREFAVTVLLGGHHQPIDGRYRWYGRLRPDPGLTALVGTGRIDAEIRTPHGAAIGRLHDPDLWNRYRIEGWSVPPFPVAVTIDEIEG